MAYVFPYSSRVRGVLTYLAQYEGSQEEENSVITDALCKYFSAHGVFMAPRTIEECVADAKLGYMTILADGDALCQVKE